MIVTAEPQVASPRRRRWRRPALAAAVLVPVVAWLSVGLTPSIAEGNYGQRYDLVAASDGFVETRYVAADGAGRLGVSVLNDGPVPVTLTAAATDEYSLHDVVGFRLIAPDEGFDLSTGLSDSVRLGPGEQAGVLLAFALTPCVPYDASSSATIETVPLQARTLGVRSDLDLVLPLPVTLRGPVVPGPDCPG